MVKYELKYYIVIIYELSLLAGLSVGGFLLGIKYLLKSPDDIINEIDNKEVLSKEELVFSDNEVDNIDENIKNTLQCSIDTSIIILNKRYLAFTINFALRVYQ
jgi:hypothetical protein